jgi:calcineurin-like phosphoesterase family protein
MIHFVADTHFWHGGMLKYSKRSYVSIEQMNDDIIKRWNERVDPTDTVYHLGDLSFSGLEKTVSIVGQLNGHIKLVPGNHDNPQMIRRLEEMKLIEVMPPLHELKTTTHGRFVLCHFPLLSWNLMHHGGFHLHGHSHGNLHDDGLSRRMDVGIDAHGRGAPISIDLIVQHLRERPGVPVDHHTRTESKPPE